MRWPIIGPGRVGAPTLEPGDAVALANRHGVPVGEWVQVTTAVMELRFTVPPDAGPVKHYLVRDVHGRIQWWSEPVWHPAAMPGDRVSLPVRPAPSIQRARPPVERLPAPEPVPPAPTVPPVAGPRHATARPKPGPPTPYPANHAPVIRWSSQ